MIPQKAKLELTTDAVREDIVNVIGVLTALDKVIPGKMDAPLIEALQYIESNEVLLALLTAALQKL